jgi:hypothetical protein
MESLSRADNAELSSGTFDPPTYLVWCAPEELVKIQLLHRLRNSALQSESHASIMRRSRNEETHYLR